MTATTTPTKTSGIEFNSDKWDALTDDEKRKLRGKFDRLKDKAIRGMDTASSCESCVDLYYEGIGFRNGRLVYVSSENWDARPITTSDSFRIFVRMQILAAEKGYDGNADEEPYKKWLKLVEKIIP